MGGQQGRLQFEYECKQDDGLVTSYGGLPLVAETLRALGAEQSVAKHIKIRKRNSLYNEYNVIEALVLLMAAGGDCLDDLQMLREDKALARLLGQEICSPETARNFLYAFHDDELIAKAKKELPPDEVAYVPEENKVLKGLGDVQKDFVRAVAARGSCKVATVDMDATIQESHKREAKWHYENGRGYQPEVAVWAEQDLILADEFRDGNVPAGKDTLRITKRAFAVLPPIVSERRFRGDSACYNFEQLEWLARESIEFTISADMTALLKSVCVKLPEEKWTLVEKRSQEEVHVGEVAHIIPDWPKELPRPRFLAVRLTPTQGKLFEDGVGPKYLGVATNRKGTALELVKWHWEKAGTIEHVHDVVKNELGGGVLPCGRFGANAAWFRVALLTYNVLSAMKSIALPPDLHDARPKRLRFQIFTLPAIVAQHARQLWVRLIDRACRGMDVLLGRKRLWLKAAPASG